MTGVEWMQQQLARYTYKPGWVLSIQPTSPVDYWRPGLAVWAGEATFIAEFEAPDSRNPSKVIPLVFNHPVDSHQFKGDEASFGRWLERTLMMAEDHEMHEWLRRDGVLVKDPHRAPDMPEVYHGN